MDNLILKRVDKSISHEWDEFVLGTHRFYTLANNLSLSYVMQDEFGYAPENYAVYGGGGETIIGLITCLRVSPNRIVSLPHFSYGGIIHSSKLSNDIHKLFTDCLDCKWEIRCFESFSEYTNTDKVMSYLKLENSEEEQLGKLRTKLRTKIRRSYKNNLQLAIGGLAYLDDYYKVYTRNMLYLGSPPLPKTFFQRILTNYEGGEASILMVYKEKEPVGCAFLISYLEFIEVCWSSALRDYNKYSVNMFLYWEMIKYSINRKFRIFSFGRSTRGSTVHQFKKQWGTTDRDIYFNYSEPKIVNHRRLTVLSSVWRRLPIRLANYLGPKISSRLY